MANLGIIQYASQIDKEACRYADKVRALRQQEYDTAVVYSDREQEMIVQNERLEQDFIAYFKSICLSLDDAVYCYSCIRQPHATSQSS